jgi:hypothetical protein
LAQCDEAYRGNQRENFRCRIRVKNAHCPGHWNRIPECRNALH